MSKIDDGGRAFPGTDSQYLDNITDNGMSLRDYYAGQALMGACAHINRGAHSPEATARHCFDLADAMIKARKVQA